MRIPKRLSTFVAITMSIFMSHIPATVLAEEMISTSAVVADLSRAEAQNNVASFLENEAVRAELLKQGVTPSEVTSRIASLSAVELKQLSAQLDEARAGGDILMAILIVVLIIFLIKRI